MKNFKFEKYFWGIFLILGAVFILISSMGYLPGINTMSLILTVILVAVFIKGLLSINFWEILFSLAFGCIIYSDQLGLGAITPWPVLGAALLGSIGLEMIFHRKHDWGCCHHHSQDDGEHCSFAGEQVLNGDDESSVHCSTSFSGVIKYINSEDFRDAYLETSFGSLKVYFDNATILQKEAVVKVEASFGGIELFIPKEWKVVNHTRASFGALDEKNKRCNRITETSPTLIIEGDISFAGVTVYYV